MMAPAGACAVSHGRAASAGRAYHAFGCEAQSKGPQHNAPRRLGTMSILRVHRLIEGTFYDCAKRGGQRESWAGIDVAQSICRFSKYSLLARSSGHFGSGWLDAPCFHHKPLRSTDMLGTSPVHENRNIPHQKPAPSYERPPEIDCIVQRARARRQARDAARAINALQKPAPAAPASGMAAVSQPQPLYIWRTATEVFEANVSRRVVQEAQKGWQAVACNDMQHRYVLLLCRSVFGFAQPVEHKTLRFGSMMQATSEIAEYEARGWQFTKADFQLGGNTLPCEIQLRRQRVESYAPPRPSTGAQAAGKS